LEYARCYSVLAVQRAFRREYRKEPPCKQSIMRWYRPCKDSGCLCKRKSTDRPKVPDETVERVRESFMRSPQKSTVWASRELGLPQQTVKRLWLVHLTWICCSCGCFHNWLLIPGILSSNKTGHIRRYLNDELPHRCIWRVGPPRSPDLTPCDFFLWGYIKDLVYVPPLSRLLVELRERIAATLMTIDRMMLQNVWNELDYRLDVCRVTQGVYIEHL
jgi:hypothetical protein